MTFSLPTILLALIVPLSLPAACAELFDPEDGMLDMSRYLQDNPYGFLPVPMAITEPAVGYGGGCLVSFYTVKGRGMAIILFRRRSPLLAAAERRTGPGSSAAATGIPGIMTVFAIWCCWATPILNWISIPTD